MIQEGVLTFILWGRKAAKSWVLGQALPVPNV